MRDEKLYLVTHAGLTAGYQVAQVAHVMADFALKHRQAFTDWHNNSQFVVALQTGNADELNRLLAHADANGFVVEKFYEPDLGHELTALAFLPSQGVSKFLSKLSLAGSRKS